MFTGLVVDMGEIAGFERNGAGEGARLRVRATIAADLTEGASVAVNGVCLTAVGLQPGEFSADLSRETLDRTTLESLEVGSRVNLELAMRASDRLGGHVVQGHVDGVATVIGATGDSGGRELRFEVPESLLRYIVEKGSVTVDGVSLTANAVDERGFSVALIPETLARTNLTEVEIGDRANLEVDVNAKLLEKLVQKS